MSVLIGSGLISVSDGRPSPYRRSSYTLASGKTAGPEEKPLGRPVFHVECPRGDSNTGIYLRRVALYPLSYGGLSGDFTTGLRGFAAAEQPGRVFAWGRLCAK